MTHPTPIHLDIRPLADGRYLASARLAEDRRGPEHLMIFSDAAPGALRTEGGNPSRFFAPSDPLWWLGFAYAEAPPTLEIEGELRERA